MDEVIAFKPLTEETLQGIAALMLDEYKPGMKAKGIAYSYTPAALKALVQKSQGGRFGARDLRRTIRKAVEDPISEALVDGRLGSQPAAVTVSASSHLTAQDGWQDARGMTVDNTVNLVNREETLPKTGDVSAVVFVVAGSILIGAICSLILELIFRTAKRRIRR